MGGVTPVVAVDGRTIGTGSPGPCTTNLAAAQAARMAAEGTPLV
jgi:branched-chain amino acid aminotransferase